MLAVKIKSFIKIHEQFHFARLASFFLLASIFFITPVKAQVLKKITEKAKQAVETKIEQEVNKKVDELLENKKTKTPKSSKESDRQTQSESSEKTSEIPTKTADSPNKNKVLIKESMEEREFPYSNTPDPVIPEGVVNRPSEKPESTSGGSVGMEQPLNSSLAIRTSSSSIKYLEKPEMVFKNPYSRKELKALASSAQPLIPLSELKESFEFPARSPKLNSLPVLKDQASYEQYVKKLNADLNTSASVTSKDYVTQINSTAKPAKISDADNLGLGEYLKGYFEPAVLIMAAGVASQSNDALAAGNLAGLLISYGHADKALPILHYWEKKLPDNPYLQTNLGVGYFQLGDFVSSELFLTKALKEDSLNMAAHKTMIMITANKGNFTACMEHIGGCLSGGSDDEVVELAQRVFGMEKTIDIVRRSKKPYLKYPAISNFKLPVPADNLVSNELLLPFIEEFRREAQQSIDTGKDAASQQRDAYKKEVKEIFEKYEITQDPKLIRPFMGTQMQSLANAVVGLVRSDYLRDKEQLEREMKKALGDIDRMLADEIRPLQTSYNNKIAQLEERGAGEPEMIPHDIEFCKNVNSLTESYLGNYSSVLSGYIRKMDLLSMEAHSEMIYWSMRGVNQEPTVEAESQLDYMQDMVRLLSYYPTYTKRFCEEESEEELEEGEVPELPDFDDIYCQTKFSLSIGLISFGTSCYKLMVEVGQGVTGEFKMEFNKDYTLDKIVLGGGPKVKSKFGSEEVAEIETAAGIQGYVEVGFEEDGSPTLADAGFEVSVTSSVQGGGVGAEAKVIEIKQSILATNGFQTSVDGIISKPFTKL